jgi:hypothetical protein
MSPRPAALTLLLTALAGGARAQTYDPAATQRMLNQQQIDIQSQQLTQLQRQNNAALQQPDPSAALQTAAMQQRLNQQAADLNAARMQAPYANPADLAARLQQSAGALPPILPPPP